MKAILLVTWIISGQSPNSYQTIFDSMEACQAARAAVIEEAFRLNTEWEQRAEEISRLMNEYHRAPPMAASGSPFASHLWKGPAHPKVRPPF